MSNALTIGFTIQVGGTSYHSITDLGLAVHNTNYIGEPEVDTSFASFPTMSGFYDISEILTQEPIYKQRTIKLEVGTIDNATNWDARMSTLYNTFHGRQAQIIFDNDLTYYWEGRIAIQNYQRTKSLGTFDIVMLAQPFKFAVTPTIDNYTADGDITLPTSSFSLIPEIQLFNTAMSDFQTEISFYDIWGMAHNIIFDENDERYISNEWFTIPLLNSKCLNAYVDLTDTKINVRWRAKSL